MALFQKAWLRSNNQEVRVLPRISNKDLQPSEYERICISYGKIIELALVLRTSLRFPNNDGGPTGPRTNSGSLDKLLKAA